MPSPIIRMLISAVSLLIDTRSAPLSALDATQDQTANIEFIGCPLKKAYPSGEKIYARNIWDMITFRGKIYLGGGNSSNVGPAINAGPVPLFSLNPHTGVFVLEHIVQEEQIDQMYTFDDQLYIPGHDPKAGWDLGNFYRLEQDGKWRQIRTLPGGIHNYTMAWDGERLFAGLGTNAGAMIATSQDKGSTWTTTKMPGGRVYSIFTINRKFYAAGRLMKFPKDRPRRAEDELSQLYVLDENGSFTPSKRFKLDDLFPDTIMEDPVARLDAAGKKFYNVTMAKIVKPLTIGTNRASATIASAWR